MAFATQQLPLYVTEALPAVAFSHGFSARDIDLWHANRSLRDEVIVFPAANTRSNKSKNDDDDGRDVAALNKARTDIRNFLTQRSIQSFIFLLHQCRDGATVRWLEVSSQKHCQSL